MHTIYSILFSCSGNETCKNWIMLVGTAVIFLIVLLLYAELLKECFQETDRTKKTKEEIITEYTNEQVAEQVRAKLEVEIEKVKYLYYGKNKEYGIDSVSANTDRECIFLVKEKVYDILSLNEDLNKKAREKLIQQARTEYYKQNHT